MGMFSWLTDTKESIANVYSGREVKTAYLLQPNGAEPIAEKAYLGYGTFGSQDAYEWLAMQNTGVNSRQIGVFIDHGSYYEDDEAYYVCSMHINSDGLRLLVEDRVKKIIQFDHYESPFRDGLSVNQAIDKGLIAQKTVSCNIPLKFSFDPHAVYEDLPASEDCPAQGMFY